MSFSSRKVMQKYNLRFFVIDENSKYLSRTFGAVNTLFAFGWDFIWIFYGVFLIFAWYDYHKSSFFYKYPLSHNLDWYLLTKTCTILLNKEKKQIKTLINGRRISIIIIPSIFHTLENLWEKKKNIKLNYNSA